ncbi:MAG TPA: GNAT family N-acetyltransferase [Burkholderiales bacterium]|nr:GNAT family N-acetyltransferase [Burkholderiales bacterium]
MKLVHVTDGAGQVVAPEWLARAQSVHRQLRTAMPASYEDKLRRVFAQGGRMVVAADGERVLGVAVWRCYEDTFNDRKLYVDDLVTDEAERSAGVGRALLAECERLGRELGARVLALDSGVQRGRAHAFYFREGMTVTSFGFRKAL